jgi:excisionase family DNA binding protein
MTLRPQLDRSNQSVKGLPEILTIPEVAQTLRCSKAHVCNVVNGKVKNTPRLPAIRLGRRILIRRETLELWKRASEQGTEIDAMMPGSGKSAVDAWKEEFHA